MRRFLSALPILSAALVLLAAAGCQLSKDVDGLSYDVASSDSTVHVDTAVGTDVAADDAAPADTGTAGDGVGTDDATDGGGGGGGLPDDPFADPVAVVATADFVFVANENLGADGTPGLGFVTVIDRPTRTVLTRIPTSQPAPRALAIAGETLLVVNRGLITEGGADVEPTPSGPCGVDLLADIATAGTATAFDSNLEIEPRGLVGAPHSVAIGADDRAYLGSATTGAVFVMDVANARLLRGVSDPVVIENTTSRASLTVRTDASGLVWVAERERSLLHAYDPETDTTATTVVGAPYALGSDGLTAPTDIVFRPGQSPDVFVLLGETDQIAAIDSATGTVTKDWAALGPAPASIGLDGDAFFASDADEAALARITLDGGGDEPAFALFPEGAAPGAFAFAGEAGAREAWVVLPGIDAVAVVDLAGGWTASVLGGAAPAATCVPSAIAPDPLPDPVIASPEAALYAGGFVFVANANVGVDGLPGQGFVTVIDPDSLAVVNRIPTTQVAPGALAADDRWLYVVNEGPTDRDAVSGLVVPTGAGGVDWIDLRQAATATAPTANVAIAPGVGGPPAGAPGGISLPAADAAAIAVLGSTVGPYAFTLDLGACAMMRGSDDPVNLDVGASRNDVATAFPGPAGLVAVALRDVDRVHFLNPGDGSLDPGPWKSPYDVSAAGDPGGPVDGLRFEGGTPDLYVLLASAAAVATIESGSDTVTPEWVSTAAGPTRLRAFEGRVYVVNGTADAVQRVTVATGDSVATFFALPTGSAPTDIAFASLPRVGTRAFVTNLLAGTVSVFDLKDGASLGTIP